MSIFGTDRPDSYILLLLLALVFEGTEHVRFVEASELHHGNSGNIIVPDLPPKHYQYWLKNNPGALAEFKQICGKYENATSLEDLRGLHVNLTIENEDYFKDISILKVICSTVSIAGKSCWGYENSCQIIHLMPECDVSSKDRTKSEQEQKISWFSSADFGYIMDRRKELARFCSPDKYSNDTVKSSLECTKHFKTCRAENLMIKLTNIPKSGSLITNKPVESVIRSGDIGGWNCDLQLKRIQEENGQTGILQSWFNELKNYNKLSNPENGCDLTINKQAYVLKLDSPSNMYHYFCNFLNLYATLHLNNRFSTDNQIIIWDGQLPKSNFELMWSAFSRNKPMSLRDLGEGKRVCFKKVIFSLLPRMIDGLYYNTPLISGCRKSGLFDAFNKHVLYKFKIHQEYDLQRHLATVNKLIRITIISRSTPHRRILNERELKDLIGEESQEKGYQAELIDLSKLNFREQLRVVQNSDILVGIHGAGLTNCLFLPDWAALIEVNNCNDKCYYDLARLRGVNYFTSNEKNRISERVPVTDVSELENLTKSNLVNHEKFSNYKIYLSEFMEVLDKVTQRVRKNRKKQFGDQIESIEQEQSKEDTRKSSSITSKHEEL